jgi:cell division protein FtsA
LAGNNLVVGLDIGTTKTVVLVGEVDNYGGVSIIGVGEQVTVGVRKGSITDLEGVIKSITQALEKAEYMSGCHLDNVYISISGGHLTSLNNKGVVAITNKSKEITVEDVHRVIQTAKVVALPPNRKIVHVHPRQYIVDGNECIIDPVGMAGQRLEAEINIVSASTMAVQNLLKCIQRAGLQEEEFLPAPLASAESGVFEAETGLGCLLVDIGGGTTEFAIYDQGRLWYTSVLPAGGNLITSDIAIGLRTTVEVAEDIKNKYGCVLSSLVMDNEMISVQDILGQNNKQISKKMLTQIIELRAQEILSLIKNELKLSGYQGILPGGMIITGGTAKLNGLVEFAAQEMDLSVRVGFPHKINGVGDNAQEPAYANVTGLILYGARQLSSVQVAPAKEHFFDGILDKIKYFFKDFFA